ncbi:thioredoxin family protein [Mycobacterium sp.]|uniref:thioredoxin family protein n=1 Tax=Mycobacterium sp. TaxID=1785 RepID=UPI002C79867A|nr:thioredoxin family protein [Mycobacterium sp.]HTY33044.1 thioredoxin family protein [Mycobacterium sp.]
MIAVVISTVAAVVVATLGGWLLTRRSGRIREVHSDPGGGADTADLALSRSGPTIVHFSAPWCGPCDRVRRVVGQVCEDMGDPGSPIAHLEIDLDADPGTARRFSVLSLPTTLIFDAEGRQRYRASGVPKAADLRSALQPLLA